MAAKIKCPGCGAKNDAALGRCRICTAMLKPAGKAVAPEPAPVVSIDESFDVPGLVRSMAPTEGLRGSAESGEYSATPGAFGPSPVPADAGISFDVQSRHADVPPPVYDAPETESWDAESWDAGPGISFEVAPRHGAEPPPPVFEDSGASWASGGGIGFDVAPRRGGEASPPVVEPNVSFDLNALEIEEPPI